MSVNCLIYEAPDSVDSEARSKMKFANNKFPGKEH